MCRQAIVAWIRNIWITKDNKCSEKWWRLWLFSAQEHKNCGEMTEIEAKVKYVKLARSLQTYGVSFFLVKVRVYFSTFQIESTFSATRGWKPALQHLQQRLKYQFTAARAACKGNWVSTVGFIKALWQPTSCLLTCRKYCSRREVRKVVRCALNGL